MTDARVVVYRLRAVADSSSAAVIKKFGADIQNAMAPKSRTGGDAFGKIGEGLRRAAKDAGNLDSQMAKVNAAFNKRVAAEEKASKRAMGDIDKQIAALKRREAMEEAAAVKAEAREHRRHRARQRGIAMQNRASQHEFNDSMRASGAASGYTGRLVGGAIGDDRSLGKSGASAERLSKGDREAAGGLMEPGRAFAFAGLAGEENTAKMLQGIMQIEAAMAGLRGLGMLAKGGPMGMLLGGGALAIGAAGKFRHELATGKNSDPNSWTFRSGLGISKALVGLDHGVMREGSWESSFINADKSQKALEAAQRTQDFLRERRQLGNELGGNRARANAARFEARQGSNDFQAGLGGAGDDRMTNSIALFNLHQDEQSATVRSRAGRTRAERDEASEELVKLQTRALELVKERARIEQQSSQDRLSSQREYMSHLDSERHKHLEIAKSARDRLRGSAERFGDLDPDEQARVVSIKKRFDEADRGGAFHGASIRSQISAEDRQLLRSVGDKDSERQAGLASIESARRGGFYQNFGGVERSEIAANERTAQKLSVELRDKRDLIVKIERDDRELIARVRDQVFLELKKRDEMTAREIAKSLSQSNAETIRSSQEAASQRQQTAKFASNRGY